MRVWLTSMFFGLMAFIMSGSACADEAVTVRLKWLNQAQFAGFYVAKEKGYYKAAGLDVSIQPGGPDFPAVQMVAGGSEQFGVTGADQILIGRDKGVPVVALAVLYRKNPFVLFALSKTGIDAPAKFPGKNIGVKIGGNEELIYRAVIKSAGIDKSQVTETPVKFDVTPLLTGQVDVWPGYLINEVLTAKEKGFDVTVISPGDYGVSLYADTLFTTEKMLKEKPAVVRAFVTATMRGWADAIADPEDAAAITVKYGSKLTYNHELAMMKASIPLLKPDGAPLGAMDEAGWNKVQSLLQSGKFLKAPIEVSKAFTTEFIVP